MFQSADRLTLLPQADIRAMTRECEKLGGYNLSQGVCDLPTPKEILEATQKAVAQDLSVYAPAQGILPLREKIAEKVRRDNQLDITADDILVTCGVTGAFASLLTALFNPGDGVIMLEPYYGYHYNECVITCLKPQVARHGEGFRIDIGELEKVVTADSKAIVVCTPGNPSGRMYDQDELQSVLKFAEKHNLLVIADEIYEYFRYDGRSHVSLASLPGAGDRVITMMGLSKTFSITGWRLGYLILPKWAMADVTRANDLLYVCAPTPLQYGVVAGFDIDRSYYDEMIEEFTVKRDKFCAALEGAGLPPVVPEGSYYVLADVSAMNANDSIEASFRVLREAKVASVPGQAFFQSELKDRYIRFCFAVEDEVLDGAITNLKKFKELM